MIIKIFLVILGLILSYILYFKYIAPISDYVNKSYQWHSAHMNMLPYFRKKEYYIYYLKDLALCQRKEKDKNHLLLICTDLASDLRMFAKEEDKERATEIFKEIMEIYQKET